MQEQITYADLAGRRHLRRYVVAALILCFIIGSIIVWLIEKRATTAVRTGSTPVTLPFQTKTPDSSRVANHATTNTPIPTPAQPNEICPTDPDEWRLLDVYPGDNYKRIAPDCVYAGLAKTVAWRMLERLGYSKPEAAQMLAFPALPWQPTSAITGFTNTQGPLLIPLDMEWAAHPAYRTWIVTAAEEPALTYSLRGCYRTPGSIGSLQEDWGTYPVLCVVAYDREPGWTVSTLDEWHFSVDLTTEAPLRRFVLFGYAAETWVLLGEMSGQQFTLEETDLVAAERVQVSAQYGAMPWDAAWLAATFDLHLRALPSGWQSFGLDSEVIQAMTEELNQALDNFGGSQ